MPFNITFHDFTHGQLDKALKSRSDLDIYTKGALELKNVVVRPGGAVQSRFGTEFLFESPTDLLEPENGGYQMFAFAPSEDLKLLIILGSSADPGPPVLSRYQYYVEINDGYWTGVGAPATGSLNTITATGPAPGSFQIDTQQVSAIKYRSAQNQTQLVLATGTQEPILIKVLPAAPWLETSSLSFRRYPQHDFTQSGYIDSTFGILSNNVAPSPGTPSYFKETPGNATTGGDPINDFPALLINPVAPTPDFAGFYIVPGTPDNHYVGGVVQMAGPIDDPTAPIGYAIIVSTTAAAAGPYPVCSNTCCRIRIITPIDISWRVTATPFPPNQGVKGDQMVLTENAFSNPEAGTTFTGRGWPRTVSFYESRLVFAGTAILPQSLFMSQIGSFNNFDTGTGEPAEGIAYTIASGAEDQIINVVSGRSLQVFTTTNEFSAPVWSEQGLTPATISIRRQTSIGSSNCIPAILDNMTMYSKRGGKAVMAYESRDSGGNSYNSEDASVHSSEIINNPIHMTSYVENTAYDANLLFVINKKDEESEGNLTLFESLREQSVQAWTTLETEGEFVNVESVGDDVFFIVKRRDTQASTDRWSLEKMNWLAVMDGAISGTAALPGAQPPVTLPTFMWGKTIEIVGWTGDDPQRIQGVWLGEYVVPNNGVFIADIPGWQPPGGTFQYWIGLKFEQLIQTMPVDIKTQMGSMLFLKKKIFKCYVEYMDSYPFFVNGIEADLRSLAFANGQYQPGYIPGIQLNAAEEPFSGIWMRPTMQKLNIPPASGTAFRGFVREATVLITNSRPLPMIIQGITAATS